jgi:hypothetical protein
MGYGFTTLLRSHGDLPYVEAVLLIRGLASPAGHAAWTGLAAAPCGEPPTATGGPVPLPPSPG